MLAKNILFSHLDNKERQELFDFMREVRVEAGTVVIQQDDAAANEMYVVASGELDVFKDYKDGKGPVKVFKYGPGGVFGELALMYNTPRAATAKATTPCVLYSIDRVTFHSLIESETRKKRKLYAEFLSSVPLLQNLDPYEKLKIADALTTETFDDGAVIVKEGDAANKFYLILEGQVKVTKQGVETHNSPLEPWQYFGELALLSDEKRQATCTAVGGVKLAAMDRESFDALLGPCKDILERNISNYTREAALLQEAELLAAEKATAEDNAAAFAARKKGFRRGGISAESTERLLTALEWRPPVRKKSAASSAALEETFGKSFLLAGMSEPERRELYDAMLPEKFREGDYVIRQGAVDADRMYVVFRGELDVFKDNFDGKGPVKVYHYSDGDVFGELALMYDAPRAASVVCVTNVKAWSVDRLTFRTLLMNGAKRRREIYQEFLGSVPLLQNLDRYERLKIADALTTEVFADGQVIVREGEPGDKFYLILEGQVKVTKNGVETHNSPLEPWQYFGELALLGDEKRHATCTALGKVQVAVMDKASFDSLLGPIRDIMTRNCEDYDPKKGAIPTIVAVPLSRLRKNAVSSEANASSGDEDDVLKQRTVPAPVTTRSEKEVELLERSLGGSHLLANLDVHGRRQVYNSMTLERFASGTDVIVQGDMTADKFYVVISGELDVYKDNVKVFHYSDGGVFGELALMYNTPRAATVRCVTEVLLWWVDRHTFRTVLMKESKKRRELYQDFLSKVPLLVNLDRYERLKIADSLVTDYFDEGQDIIVEGEIGNRFYLLIEGAVRVTQNGVETHNSPLRPGQYFGELALLNSDPRKATCTAIGSCKVAYMERKAFDRLLGPVKDVMERSANTGYSGGVPTVLLPLAPTTN